MADTPITITYTKSYTDTPENILFGAKFYGYQETIADPTFVFDPSKPNVRATQVPNPQSAGDFMIAKVDSMIKDFMTRPIQSFLKAQANATAQQQAAQAAQAVLNNLK